MAVPIIWELMADLDSDGDFEEDLTAYIRGGSHEGFGGDGGIRYGISREDALGAFGPRTMSVALANQDARFSTKNAASPYGTTFRRGKKVRLRATPGATFVDTTNLIENPSLETGIVGHAATGGSTVVRDTTVAFYGKCSAKVTVANLASSGDHIRKNDGTGMVVSPSTSYSFHCRVNAPAGKLMRIRIDWFTAADAFISSSSLTDFTGIGDWQYVERLTNTSPGTAAFARVLVMTQSAQGVFDFYLDGAMFYQGTNRRAYIDGDQPACVWNGSPGQEHGVTSTRLLASQQSIVQFTGRITDLRASRDPRMRGTVVMECASDDDAWYHKVISCGYFFRKKAKDIAQRVVDLLEEGELILDGAMRSTPTGGVPSTAFGPPEGETFVAVGGLQMFHVPVTAQFYEQVFEGDNAMAHNFIGDAIGDGWYVDVTARTSNSLSYTAALFVYNPVLNNGKRWTFELWDDVVGVAATATVTLDGGDWVYATVTGTFTAGATQRRIRFIALDTPVNEANGLQISGLHMVKTVNRIARTITGLDYEIESFPQSGFHRSAAALVEEFAKSATAWVYEDASGGLVFEQADTSRSNVATPKLRLTDGFDGWGYELGDDYQEGWNNIYNRIRVGSYGNFHDLNMIRRPWQLEPAGLVLGANQERILYADYAQNADGPIIARVADAKIVLTAGAMVANYPILRGYGSSAEIVVKATAAGATISELWVEGKAVTRNTSERSFVEIAVVSIISEPKLQELECPGQGYRNTRMTTLAQWAGDKYANGPAKISPTLVPGEVSTTVGGIEGWQYVMEIIGRDVGLPVWVKHKGGQSQLYLDELYYVEGRTVSQGAQNQMPRVELHLEAA